jgi:hypothetical protein
MRANERPEKLNHPPAQRRLRTIIGIAAAEASFLTGGTMLSAINYFTNIFNRRRI